MTMILYPYGLMKSKNTLAQSILILRMWCYYKLEPTTPGGVGLVYKCAARRNGLIWSSLFSRIYTFAISKCFQYVYL